MRYIADLHLHSKYSRAVSQAMVLPEMSKWAVKKGIDLLTTSDFTHPLWFREIKGLLTEDGEGIYKLKNSTEPTRFLLSTEISSIYSQGGRVRRIHNLLFAPNIQVAEKIKEALTQAGCNLSSDGRPIIGLSSRNLLELCLNIDKKIILIPCHAWTPHFGIYGSASGFDSLDEAFGDLSKYVYGIETGISSDPFMNWQISELKNRSILSFSDAHSAPKMAREATILEVESLSYTNFGKAIARPTETNRIAYTIEFYPEEGKYHYSGHRNCSVRLTPAEVKEKGNICPVCKRRLTEGVMLRVQQVAGREISLDEPVPSSDKNGVNWIKDLQDIHPPFVKLVPLLEIVAESLETTAYSEKAKLLFEKLCLELGSEIKVLLESPLEDIVKAGGEKVAEGVLKVRKGDIAIEPGYDGEYGKVKIWREEIKPEVNEKRPSEQGILF
jgi:uncharacterized protein (TIGR00375 family)